MVYLYNKQYTKTNNQTTTDMKTLKTFSILLVITAFAAVNTMAQYSSSDSEPSIVDIATSNDDFSTLAMLLTEAGLVDVLENGENYTVFAPTNAAFEEVPQETLQALLSDLDLLREVLLTHVVVGVVTSEQVVEISEAPTAAGNVLPVNVTDAGVGIGNATVIQADVMASNGVIHIVDSVIMPPAEQSGY